VQIGKPAEGSGYSAAARELLPYALAQLSELDRDLLIRLIGEGQTQRQVAQTLGISHQAISKRKRAVLQDLRWRLGVNDKRIAGRSELPE
jgi:DNA-directed RNA polymerase specialized sigma subunit